MFLSSFILRPNDLNEAPGQLLLQKPASLFPVASIFLLNPILFYVSRLYFKRQIVKYLARFVTHVEYLICLVD